MFIREKEKNSIGGSDPYMATCLTVYATEYEFWKSENF